MSHALLSHVLEHFLEPRAALGQLRGHLRPGGLLYIEVPDILHFGMGQIQSAHTYYFSPRTLRNVVESCELELLAGGAAREIHQFGIFAPKPTARAPTVHVDIIACQEVCAAIRRHNRRQQVHVILDALGLLRPANFIRLGVKRMIGATTVNKAE